MSEILVDMFELDLTKDNGDWTGNTFSGETSSCANYLNFQPFQFYFTPNGVDTISWFTDDVYSNIRIPVESFEQYIATEIVLNGYNLAYIDSTLNINSVLDMEIGLLNNEVIVTTVGAL